MTIEPPATFDEPGNQLENVVESAAPEQPGPREETSGAAPRPPTLADLALGGALVVGETIAAHLDTSLASSAPEPRTLDMILRPQAEWDTEPVAPTRQIALGVLVDARQSSSRLGRALYEATDEFGRWLDRATRPARRSAVLRPLRVRFHRYQARGELQIRRWQAMGRREEIRSRAIAGASLEGIVHSSLSDLTQSDQMQILIQQIVERQSTGLMEELLEEVRERMVSLDTLLERRPHHAPGVRAPDTPLFREAFLRARPSLAAIPEVEQTLAGHYAGFASRTAAFLIDTLLLILAISLATTFANALFNLFNIDLLIARFMPEGGSIGNVAGGLAGGVSMLIVILYGIIGWSLSGQTFGNILMGVRVLSEDGARVSFGRASLRMLGAYVSGLALFLGFFWALSDRRNQGWHDKIARTVVVYDWPAVPDEQFLRDELQVRGALPRQRRAN